MKNKKNLIRRNLIKISISTEEKAVSHDVGFKNVLFRVFKKVNY